MKDIFENDKIPSNSATITGLLTEYNKLGEMHAKIIDYRYGFIKTYKEIASEVSLSASRVQQTKNNAIRLLRNRIRFYYLPKHQEFLRKYNLFLDAVQAGSPSEEDIIVDELGFETHTSNALRRASIHTASQLFFKTEQQLLKVRNLGKNSVEEIMRIKEQLLIGFI